MRSSAVLAAVFLGGCGTQIGGEGETMCAERSREPLADPTAIPPSWTTSPAGVLDGVDEPVSGTLSTEVDDGSPGEPIAEVALRETADLDGDVAWVTLAGGVGEVCFPRVAVPGTVTLTSDAVSVDAPIEWRVDHEGGARFSTKVPLADVRGTARPGFDGVATVLWVSGSYDREAGWRVGLSWHDSDPENPLGGEEALGVVEIPRTP